MLPVWSSAALLQLLAPHAAMTFTYKYNHKYNYKYNYNDMHLETMSSAYLDGREDYGRCHQGSCI